MSCCLGGRTAGQNTAARCPVTTLSPAGRQQDAPAAAAGRRCCAVATLHQGACRPLPPHFGRCKKSKEVCTAGGSRRVEGLVQRELRAQLTRCCGQSLSALAGGTHCTAWTCSQHGLRRRAFGPARFASAAHASNITMLPWGRAGPEWAAGAGRVHCGGAGLPARWRSDAGRAGAHDGEVGRVECRCVALMFQWQVLGACVRIFICARRFVGSTGRRVPVPDAARCDGRAFARQHTRADAPLRAAAWLVEVRPGRWVPARQEMCPTNGALTCAAYACRGCTPFRASSSAGAASAARMSWHSWRPVASWRGC